MKLHKTITKRALIAASIALGAMTGSAYAAQAIHADHADMNPQQAKRAASKLKHQMENSPVGDMNALHPHMAHANATATRELLKAVGTGNIDPFVAAAKIAVEAGVNQWINALTGAVPNGAFISAGGVARQDNGGGPLTPADVNRDSLIAALNAAIDLPNTAALEVLDGARGRVAAPANASLKLLHTTDEAVKHALGRAAEAYIDTLVAGGAGNFMSVAAHAAIPGGVAPTLRPADRSRDAFKAALVNVIDGIDF